MIASLLFYLIYVCIFVSCILHIDHHWLFYMFRLRWSKNCSCSCSDVGGCHSSSHNSRCSILQYRWKVKQKSRNFKPTKWVHVWYYIIAFLGIHYLEVPLYLAGGDPFYRKCIGHFWMTWLLMLSIQYTVAMITIAMTTITSLAMTTMRHNPN